MPPAVLCQLTRGISGNSPKYLIILHYFDKADCTGDVHNGTSLASIPVRFPFWSAIAMGSLSQPANNRGIT
jgi:hypothetical protein